MGKNTLENHQKKWTKEQTQTLLENIGSTSISYVATRTGKTFNAVIRKLERLGKSDLTYYSGRFRTYEFAEIIGVDPSTILSWIKEKGLPSKQFHKKGKRDVKRRHHYIDVDEFWEWAEKNKNLIHFKKIKEGVLIPEPDWFWEARENEEKSYKHQMEWTIKEDKILLQLKAKGCTYKKIAEQLERSRNAVQRRYFRIKDNKKYVMLLTEISEKEGDRK